MHPSNTAAVIALLTIISCLVDRRCCFLFENASILPPHPVASCSSRGNDVVGQPPLLLSSFHFPSEVVDCWYVVNALP